MKLLLFLFAICACRLAICQATAAKPTVPKLSGVDPEILQLVIEDQWDRGNDMYGKGQVKSPESLDWKLLADHDAQRHAQIRKLLDQGRVKTGQDFEFAALIFQHSEKPDDLMLAHVLAVTAVGKGNGGARWLAAATLDRYLQSVKQPQIFGTQFFQGEKDQPWTMEPYARSTLTDGERALWCVVPLASQERILKDMQNGKPTASTGLENCK